MKSELEGKNQVKPMLVNIGLEVHAKVASERKLFSPASSSFCMKPNTQVSLFDIGFPGTLPVMNWNCVEQAIKTGLGLNAKINLFSIFERKNYFYPDLPNGYQISQYRHPLASGGYIDLDPDKGVSAQRINISHLHLEQDSGKSIHDIHPTKSYIDLNRSGIALMEIVSQPEIHGIREAQTYLKKLQTILRYLGTSDGNMEQGSLRVDVNISLSTFEGKLGTRVEVKNINSFRFMGMAIQHEIERQSDLLKNGLEVKSETRLFNPKRKVTVAMRAKEEVHEYRYFPDPDLPPLVITRDEVARIRAGLPELPDERQKRFEKDFGLSKSEVQFLTSKEDQASYYDMVLKVFKNDCNKQKCARVLLNIMMVCGPAFVLKLKVTTQDLATLVNLVVESRVSIKIARNTLVELSLSQSYSSFGEILKMTRSAQLSYKAIGVVVKRVISNNKDKVREYKAGKSKLLDFFIGQVMKEIKRSASPQAVCSVIKEELRKN